MVLKRIREVEVRGGLVGLLQRLRIGGTLVIFVANGMGWRPPAKTGRVLERRTVPGGASCSIRAARWVVCPTAL